MISAIILAAGESRRMGEQKLLMRWGNTTVLEHVISVFSVAGLEEILVVTGSHRSGIEGIVSPMKDLHKVRSIFNKEYASGEMLSSIQCGLLALLKGQADAALIALGDQPHVRDRNVRMVCDAYLESRSPLVVPSFNMRRGHPWLVARELWIDLLELSSHQTPRDFLNRFKEKIAYVNVEDASILADLDTPRDYADSHP